MLVNPQQYAGGLSATQRTDLGKSHREKLSREDHKLLRPKERDFDPLEVLLASSAGRLRRLLPIKYARMSVSPFAFFRGAVSIMAADLGRLPRTDIHVQLCGDAHVRNMGSFAAPDGRFVFDINDFDETICGPWEWDVKRLTASIVLAGREAGLRAPICDAAAAAFLERYHASMAEFSREPILMVARHQIRREERAKPISAALRQSQRATPADLLTKLTESDARGGVRFRERRPVLWRVRGDERKAALESLGPYRHSLSPESGRLFDLFKPVDVGFKVVGTGSVGMRDYIVLLEGNGPGDPLFLQIKQELPSAYARFLPGSACDHEGRRVAEGQQAIQPLSDLLLGWTSLGGREFVVRQLNDHKGAIAFSKLRGGGLESLARVAGELLARGHARSADSRLVYGYCGGGTKICKALLAFGIQYADQTEADYARFRAAVKKGRIPVADEF